MLPPLARLAGALSLGAAFANAQSSFTVTATAKAASASGVSKYIPPEYAGFGIEPSNLFSFTGGAETNQFTINLMENLANYTGKPGAIRLGGNTQDYFLYQESMTQYIIQTNKNSVGQGAIASDSDIIGPGYFEAVSRFPKGTPITFGLNLAYEEDDYLDQITLMASAALNNLSNVELISFEIGNEPDLYLENGFRTGAWDGSTYVDQWTTRAKAVYERVLKAADLPINFFEGPCTASTIGTTFEIDMLVDNGIQTAVENSNKPYLKAWNQHDYLYFIDVSTFAITVNWMMDLDNTVSQFEYWASQIKIALDTGLPYQLREMQSVGPVGLAGVSDTFGAALWNLNFFLYGATLNMSSVQMHMTDNSFAAPWQPIQRNGVAKNVRPVYYAYAAMAQFIGSGNGTTQIASLSNDNVPSGYKSNVRQYAGYGGGELTSYIIINSMQKNATEDKNTLDITINVGSDFNGQNLYLSYLTADGADSTTGTTWNGMQYSDDDGKATTVNDTAQSVKISNGRATVSVRDSQALIAYIGAQLGTNAVTLNGTTVNRGDSNSASSSSSSGSTTATIAAIASTSLALASSITGSAATSTATSGAARAGERGWGLTLLMGFTVFAIATYHAW
ncbi:Glycoside hydrolase superfamily [Neofusicoccum parvum]|uniref:Glycoside hydrolase superfamily n=2 Tax=Neofusicoccum parvum TaxID=310453 RepID=A0ACB5SAM0_9PEZI|nr:putative glycoside hydrolase family 79 protein [Neofusicoccum parvum UCRNP2]GME32825.1 Glycoside hydrolase superfamily [Neofusicoccum parvum]GME33792.1 Glycoside hydrolase superfamily [Neofusicoccum parvum]